MHNHDTYDPFDEGGQLGEQEAPGWLRMHHHGALVQLWMEAQLHRGRYDQHEKDRCELNAVVAAHALLAEGEWEDQ